MNPKLRLRVSLGILIGLIGGGTSVMADHPAYVAGAFYTDSQTELRNQVDTFLGGAPKDPSEFLPRILLVPHAGYEYSGRTAGKVYAEIRGEEYPLVILVGVAHRVPVRGVAIENSGFFSTPLGRLEVDASSAAELLKKSPDIRVNSKAFQGEHSLETQFPFLQRALKNFKIVPLLMNDPELEAAQSIGHAIAALIREKQAEGIRTLLVLSTDFAHYPSAEDAKKSDQAMIDKILALNPSGLFETSEKIMAHPAPNLVTTMCGEAGVLAGLYAAKNLGTLQPKLIAHATSADSDPSSVYRSVGYGGIAFFDPSLPRKKKETQAESQSDELTNDQKKVLLAMARNAISGYLKSGAASVPQVQLDSALQKPAAVFVTLRDHGQLRGCIGTLEAQKPLFLAVSQYAILAATRDPRFSPVTASELGRLEIEISVLTAPKKVASYRDIIPGKDGVILSRDGRSGVFLPQVWEESGWGTEKFLSELASQKAGLPADAWKDPGTEISVFQDKAFSENDFKS